MSNYVCSVCGTAAYYDGRCGDGPILTCGCNKSGGWVDDGRGGYYANTRNAQAVESENYQGYSAEREYWKNDKR